MPKRGEIIGQLLTYLLSIMFISLILVDTVKGQEEFVPDEVIVKLKENKSLDSLKDAKVKCIASKPIFWADKKSICEGTETLQVDFPDIIDSEKITPAENIHFREEGLDRTHVIKVTDVEKAVDDLKRNPNVEYTEPNYIVYTTLVPTDPHFSKLYGLHNTGQTGGKVDADIDAPEAWDLQTGSNSIVVAVIDTGVDYAHGDLAANTWVNKNEIPNNGIDDDNNGFIDDYRGWNFIGVGNNNPFDDHGHGTHVSGTIGAVANNGIGAAGVSWNVKIMPLKFLSSSGSGSISDAIEAVEYATMMGANIMSNSWGGGGFSQAMKDAIEAANDAGILFVAAAGNSNSNNDVSPNYPSNYDVSNVVAVAATDHNDNKASFSSYGATTVDLGAPGVNIFSSVPNGSCSLCSLSGYRYLSGTSMATPHVSGALALIKSQFPELTSDGLKARLLSSVDPISALNGITVTGGRLNAFNSFETDNILPSAITDLTASNSSSSSVTLIWTATGDDNNIGTANSYDLRYSTSPIDNTNFDNSIKARNSPKPKASGSTEVFTVMGLLSSSTYYFAIKAVDNVGNKGPISNIATETIAKAPKSMSDDFDPNVNMSQWSSISLGTASTSCGSVSGNALYFSGTGAREAVTNNINVTARGSISFSLKIGTGIVPCENADLGEEVKLEYSTNGGITWNLIKTYNQDSYPSFTVIEETIPAAARTANTRFRWIQPLHSGISYDNWAIDDVIISAEELQPNPPPIADANGPYNGTEDVPLTFNGSGSSDPENDSLTYKWNFGDGVTGTGVIPNHTYTSGGTYTVTLTVNDGKVNSLPNTTIAIITEINDAPVANPNGPYNGTEDVPLTFDGSKSSDLDNDNLTYLWNFGDGNTGVGIRPAHTYTAGGNYTVTLIVDDKKVNSLPNTTTATIEEVNDAPMANAGPDQNLIDLDGNGFETVTLDASASFDIDGTIVVYSWGKGLNIIGIHPILKTDLSVGVHTIILTVTDDKRLSSSDSVIITIAEKPKKCGDGIIDASEQCDDANTVSGDGCSSNCSVEQGYFCTNQPSVCTKDRDNDNIPNLFDCNDFNSSIGSCGGCAVCSEDSTLNNNSGKCVAPLINICPEIRCPSLGICGATLPGISCKVDEMAIFPATQNTSCIVHRDIGWCFPRICDPIACTKNTDCLKDSDGDSIPDAQDKCPNSTFTMQNIYGYPTPTINKFSRNLTTNLSFEDLEAVKDFRIGVESKAEIWFKNNTIRLYDKQLDRCSQYDFDKFIKIGQNFVEINSENLSNLNISAVITFYNITYSNPRIVIDNIPCDECNIISYANNTLVINVSHFSVITVIEESIHYENKSDSGILSGILSRIMGWTLYEVSEGQYCGDGACNNEETCSSCPTDCGGCLPPLPPPPPTSPPPEGGSPDGGGGGGGGGSGGGGGGGGSGGIAALFKKVFVIQKLTAGEFSSIELDEQNIAFTKIRFNSLIDQLNGVFIISNIQTKPDFLTSPEWIVYQYLEIEIPRFAESKDFNQVTINFRVDTTWIKDNKIDKDSIRLHRYEDITTPVILPTTLTREDTNYTYFTAISPELSYFVITGKKTEILKTEISREKTFVEKEEEEEQKEGEKIGVKIADIKRELAIRELKIPIIEDKRKVVNILIIATLVLFLIMITIHRKFIESKRKHSRSHDKDAQAISM